MKLKINYVKSAIVDLARPSENFEELCEVEYDKHFSELTEEEINKLLLFVSDEELKFLTNCEFKYDSYVEKI